MEANKIEVKATANTVRITPRKARLVIDMIRGKNVNEAAALLKLTNKGANEAVIKVLNSSVANAEHNNGLNKEYLYVKAAYVNDGLRMKRMLPRAKGRGDVIIKRTCNITVIVAERN